MTMIEIRQFMAWMKESEVKWIYLCVTMTQCANLVVIFSNGISFGLKYARLTRGHVINHNKKSAEVSVACYHFRALHVMNFFFFFLFSHRCRHAFYSEIRIRRNRLFCLLKHPRVKTYANAVKKFPLRTITSRLIIALVMVMVLIVSVKTITTTNYTQQFIDKNSRKDGVVVWRTLVATAFQFHWRANVLVLAHR